MKTIKGRLLYISGNKGLLFKNGTFYSINITSGDIKRIARLPMGGVKIMLSHWRFANRLLRLEPRSAGRLSENGYVVCILGKLWLVETSEGRLTELCNTRPGYSVLGFCEKRGCLYWGDYGPNPNHDEINIYRIDGDLNIKILYTFNCKSIRHIHSIIKDGNDFLVMAGDNEPYAGIYRANAGWTEVKPWKNGEQKYRAVVGFPYKGGFLYATDSVETENHLWYIDVDGVERDLTVINGSCIYGTETQGFFLFSTTVESHEGNGVCKLLSNELGGGIKNKEIHIIAVDKEDLSVRVIKKYKKDIWPMKLFQYGRAPFAGGQEGSTTGVWCYPIACVGMKGRSDLIAL